MGRSAGRHIKGSVRFGRDRGGEPEIERHRNKDTDMTIKIPSKDG